MDLGETTLEPDYGESCEGLNRLVFDNRICPPRGLRLVIAPNPYGEAPIAELVPRPDNELVCHVARTSVRVDLQVRAFQ